MAHITLRIDIEGKGSVGPGKIRLLELIEEHGSIRKASAAQKMSYGRAWGLVQELNGIFGKPVLHANPGGKAGGGAHLTPLGRNVVAAYRAAEHASARAAGRPIAELQALAGAAPRPASLSTSPTAPKISLSTTAISPPPRGGRNLKAKQ